MLERVVGIVFRAAYGREDSCSSSMAEGCSSAGATSATEGHSPQSKQEGDIEIDNSNHVLVKIATLYAERLMNDICLVVGGVEYPAHRLILCASSEVFQVMLMNPRWSESHESRVVLQEPPSCSKIFGEFLRYFYTGQIRINHNTIMPILVLADKYNVKDLITLCLNYMCNHIAHAAAHNQVVTWFQYTFSLGHYQVAQACENFIKWNFRLVAMFENDFGNFQIEMLSRLLQQNDLVVQNEMTVYNCVVSWLDHQKRLLTSRPDIDLEEEMEALVKQVMAHVRFPMMTPRQLAELLLSPLTSQYKEFFIERMAIGMSYHSDQTDRIQEVCQMEGGRLLFTPRLYTADKWSSLLTVDNFTQIQPYYPQTLMFSSQAVFAEYAGDRTCDWVIDLYPKGVWFQKFFLIVWQGTVEVPESVLRTVRLSVTCKDPPGRGDDVRVRVGLLVMGVQDGVEHVMRVITRTHRFTEDDKVLNFDDVLSFDELNDFVAVNNSQPSQSPFLVGENRNTLKVNITITPLSDVCSVDNSEGCV